MAAISQDDLIPYGPDANCVLDQSSPYYCPPSYSVYGYRPALGANITFLILFFVVLLIQLWLGVRYRTWFFMGAMIIGCICEILGYGGRILLYQNPFSFNGFMLQITMITLGPAFYSAAIYVTLSRVVEYLGRQYSKIPPMGYYWLFIPCDIISLVLQGTGGGMSSSSKGESNVAINIAIAGLSFQVITLCVFIALAADFAIRYIKARKGAVAKSQLPAQFKIFVYVMSGAVVLILIRCAYRIYELHGGYTGPTIRDQGLFIGLEGVMIIIAAFGLCVAHPGRVLTPSTKSYDSDSATQSTKANPGEKV